MPPDAASPPATRADTFSPGRAQALAIMAAGAAILALLTAREWGEMLHQWWNVDTYSHILLVPFIIAWLVAIKASELAKLIPRAWPAGLFLLAAALGLWVIGRMTGINLLAHAGAVGALQALVVAAIGPRAAFVVALPIAFAAALVPFGEEIVPPLQMVTAKIAIALTQASGIPAAVDGTHIDTPAGLFIVAEACSGVRFLIAMLTLSVLVCATRFVSWRRRALFLLAAFAVPIIANGIRAWATILVAQYYGAEVAVGFDHIVYGWIFFGIVVALILSVAWRYFERAPEAYGWNADQAAANPLVRRLESPAASPVIVLAGVAALVLFASSVTGIAAPAGIG
ncbi:exosortase A [Erythrobacter sp.]|jgi:exosortase A|uniref:exosortase A n=1 Tax=Erythrobacter sp. TaxID=1042 RepID=UPI002E9BB0FC|nr:exosortase A [Erythrobacter sp.]